MARTFYVMKIIRQHSVYFIGISIVRNRLKNKKKKYRINVNTAKSLFAISVLFMIPILPIV